MRTKVTLVLLFLNVALFFFIFKFERTWRIERSNLEQKRLVLGSEAADLRNITIAGPAIENPVNLVRRADTWYLTQPFDWVANPNAVNRIRTELERLENETSFSVADLAQTGQSLADYGLADPRINVTFSSNEDGSAGHTLRVGDSTKDGKRLYVLSPDGERIHVVGNSLAESLSLSLSDLRSDVIFGIKVFEVRSLSIRIAALSGLVVRLRLDEKNRWNFEAPLVQVRADKGATDLVVNGLIGLKVKTFVASPPADAVSTTNPTLKLTLEGNNRTETLSIGSRVAPSTATSGTSAAAPADAADTTDYYATLSSTRGSTTESGTVFVVALPRALQTTLEQAQTELRERRLLPDFDPQSATAVNISGPGGEVSLQRLEAPDGSANAVWQILRRDGNGNGTSRTADSEVVRNLLTGMAQLQAVNTFIDAPTRADLENWGFSSPDRTIRVTVPGAATPVGVVLGVAGSGQNREVRAQVLGSTSIAEVRPDLLDQASLDPLAYRDRLLQQLSTGARIVRLQLTDRDTDAVILSEDLSDPASPPKSSAVSALLAQLRTLRARKFVASEIGDSVPVDGGTVPWAYELTATISSAASTSTSETTQLTLLLTKRLGGNAQYAGSTAFGAVWELEPALIDPLWEIISGASAPGPNVPSL